MAQRTGTANLPLHGGHVPLWLATRMASLGRVVVEAIVHHYGRDELLRRLAHPFWFQSFGAVMGMDWHSSGITTSVIGALKRGLAPVQDELGLYICGGRGRYSRQTPSELTAVGLKTGLDGVSLSRASRLVAKIDGAAIQDGFDLYLHAFVVGTDGKWCVVQQGMNVDSREARRYHWLSENLDSFLDSPHAAIEGRNKGLIVNLADARAERNRRAGVELVQSGPDRPIAILRQLRNFAANTGPSLFPELEPWTPMTPGGQRLPLPHLDMAAHHDVRISDVGLRRLWSTLASAADRGPKDFTELLLIPGVGARTVQALAFVAEVVHGAPSRFTDPARFSFAHGGKDRQPFPVALEVYDQTLRVMKDAIAKASLGLSDRLAAIQRLDHQSRVLEQITAGPDFFGLVGEERAKSHQYGGQSVFGIESPD